MNPKKIAGFLSTRYREPQTCESCAEQFLCGATLGGCWCMEVEVSAATRARLRERFDRCLCRACLEAFAAEDRPASAAERAPAAAVDSGDGVAAATAE